MPRHDFRDPLGEDDAPSDARDTDSAILAGDERWHDRPPTDPRLRALIDAWPALPEETRERIVGLVEGVTPTRPESPSPMESTHQDCAGRTPTFVRDL